MRVSIFLNWRYTLMSTMLALMLMGPNSPESVAGFWVEDQKRAPVSYQIVKVKTRKPTWLLSLKAALSRWPADRRLVMRLLCQLLSYSLLIWLNLLGWLIKQTLSHSLNPIEAGFVWSQPLKNVTLQVQMQVTLTPTASYESMVVENITYCYNNKSYCHTHLPTIISVAPNDSLIKSYLCQISQNSTDVEPVNQQKELIELPIRSLATKEQNQAIFQTDQCPENKCCAYTESYKRTMISFYQTLNEKDRRRYAALEAMKLAHGGQSIIARILGCSRKTIAKGIKELKNGIQKDPRIRKKGGGRKSYAIQHPQIDEQFLDVLKHYTAGDPMKEEVIWTNLTQREIAARLEQEYAVKVSQTVIKQLLSKHQFRRRKAQKRRTTKEHALRNEQFEKIEDLQAEYKAAGNPIMSMDSKKKDCASRPLGGKFRKLLSRWTFVYSRRNRNLGS